MRETRITTRIVQADPDKGLPEETIYAVQTWVPPDFSVPNGPNFRPTGFWETEFEGNDREVVEQEQRIIQVSATCIPGTEQEYLGTEAATVIFHGGALADVLARIDRYHQISRCTCQHDCCGHICGSHFEIIAAIPSQREVPDWTVIVRSEFMRNV